MAEDINKHTLIRFDCRDGKLRFFFADGMQIDIQEQCMREILDREFEEKPRNAPSCNCIYKGNENICPECND